ncbi:MAG TPA: oxidoreductase [Flavobacterium sp.]
MTKVINESAGEFRSIAGNGSVYFINAGTPALLYKVSPDGKTAEIVYQENHPKAFYDSMRFWNENEGIAIGDPTENCLSVLITRNGGQTWDKLSCGDLPKTVEGEAAFAASNTNLIVKGNQVWIVSGGKKARVFNSTDKGKSWQVFETPIVQGEAMTGIFSADFYNENTGFISGGNYGKPESNNRNKAMTSDGGKTWQLVADNSGFGYASCVQFIPGGKGKKIVSVGASGLQYSSDAGKSWTQLLADPTLYTIIFKDNKTAFAAGKDKIIRITFKQ